MSTTLFQLILQFQQDERRPDARRASAELALVCMGSERNNADGRLSSCLKGAAQIHHCGGAALGKKATIDYELRLAFTYLGGCENRKKDETEY